MSVGIVVVSHSASLAAGVVELAAEMAQGVVLAAAGGTEDGGIGTSYERIEEACRLAGGGGDGVLILCDLGSAVMTSELYLDTLDDDERSRFRLADAPLVEGAVAAGVVAAQGGSLEDVARAAHAAWGRPDEGGERKLPEVPAQEQGDGVSRTLRLVNPLGLHARPAAMLVKLAAGFDAEITIGGVNAASLLSVMGLGVQQGEEVLVTARGPQDREAIEAISRLIEDGFGEAPAP